MKEQLQSQQLFFEQGHTRPLSFRLEALRSLEKSLRRRETELLEALRIDLGKKELEAYISELLLIYLEIKKFKRKLKSWAKPRKVGSPLFHQPSKSYVMPTPRGRVLILSPWNYPVYLLFPALIGAVAAGNCVVLRPSARAPHVAAVVGQILDDAFDQRHVLALLGDTAVSESLLRCKHDLIFFTGSERVGRQVMLAAAEQLTPVVLELGGKSPCIVDQSVDLKYAARRITWGKFLNAGQTCVAPDYLIVHAGVVDQLIEHIKDWIEQLYGTDPQQSDDFARIINETHLDRLVALLAGQNVVTGGVSDRSERYLAPTVVREPALDSPLMRDEIFGPILPVLKFQTLDEAVEIAKEHPQPLALYVFSRKPKVWRQVLEGISSGGVTINDTIAHLTAHNLPFGGVGRSGMGGYHGKNSFDTFSHMRGVLRKRGFRFDLPFRYPPFAKHRRLLALVRKWYA